MNQTLSKLTAAAILTLLATGSAFASTTCSSAPSSQWQPKSKLKSELESKGMKVRQIKTEKGCYEVYATDKDGKRQNMAFNAQTLKQLADAEAGEK